MARSSKNTKKVYTFDELTAQVEAARLKEASCAAKLEAIEAKIKNHERGGTIKARQNATKALATTSGLLKKLQDELLSANSDLTLGPDASSTSPNTSITSDVSSAGPNVDTSITSNASLIEPNINERVVEPSVVPNPNSESTVLSTDSIMLSLPPAPAEPSVIPNVNSTPLSTSPNILSPPLNTVTIGSQIPTPDMPTTYEAVSPIPNPSVSPRTTNSTDGLDVVMTVVSPIPSGLPGDRDTPVGTDVLDPTPAQLVDPSLSTAAVDESSVVDEDSSILKLNLDNLVEKISIDDSYILVQQEFTAIGSKRARELDSDDEGDEVTIKRKRVRMSSDFDKFKSFFSEGSEIRVEWKATLTPEELEETQKRYKRYLQLKDILKIPVDKVMSHDLYIEVGDMAVKLWGAAIDPWRNPSLRLPSKFREALCEVQDLLPSCSCTSIALVEHVLTTTQYIMKCPAHFKTPRRSEEGKEAIRVRQEKAKALRAETSGKPAPKPSTPPPPPPVSGQYDQFLPEDPTVSREWVLDCGCSFEMAVWAFFSWKNLWGQNTGNGAWQRMPHIPVYPREFLFQNLTNFAMVDIQHVMNWRGTGFWDRRFHIRFRKNQLVRMEMLLDELEALPSFDDPDIRGWPDVKSRMNACGALNLHRVKVEVEDSA